MLVEQFRIIQEAPARFRVQVIVRSAEDFDTVQKEFTQFIKSQLGDGIELVVERVKEIPRTASGKQPYFVSRLIGSSPE
jgi:hypothetical protein